MSLASAVTPAEVYAYRHHTRTGQRFPGTEASYMHHVHAVADVIRDAHAHAPLKNFVDYLDTAYSHDVIEDTVRAEAGYPRGRLLEEMEDRNPVSTRAAHMLTKNDRLPKHPVGTLKGALLYWMWFRARPLTQMQDSLKRINDGRHSSSPISRAASPVAAAVKLADRIVNLEFTPPGHWKPEWIEEYRQEAREVLKACGWANEYLSQRLAKAIEQYPGQASRPKPGIADDARYRQRLAPFLH